MLVKRSHENLCFEIQLKIQAPDCQSTEVLSQLKKPVPQAFYVYYLTLGCQLPFPAREMVQYFVVKNRLVFPCCWDCLSNRISAVVNGASLRMDVWTWFTSLFHLILHHSESRKVFCLYYRIKAAVSQLNHAKRQKFKSFIQRMRLVCFIREAGFSVPQYHQRLG